MVSLRYLKVLLFTFLLSLTLALLGFLSLEGPSGSVVYAQSAPNTAQMDYSQVPTNPAPNSVHRVSITACNATSEIFCDYGSGPPRVCPKQPFNPPELDPDRNGCFRSGSTVHCNIRFPSSGDVEVIGVCNRGGPIANEDEADGVRTFSVAPAPAPPNPSGVTISFNPTSVSTEGTTTLRIATFPDADRAYNLQFKLGECETGGSIGGALIITNGNSCNVDNESSHFANVSCTNGQFIGEVRASEFDTPDDTQTNTLIHACLGYPNGFAESTFTINAPDPTDTFSIDTILNEDDSENSESNPAAPGETVQIVLSGAEEGDYGFAIAGREINSSECSAGSCTLSLPIPSDINTASAEVIVIDPDDNRQSAIVYLVSDIDDELPEEEGDGSAQITCPVCPDTHKFFDKARYVCCSLFGCKLPASFNSLSGGDIAADAYLQYIVRPETDTCEGQQVCWEGKGCIITAEDPSAPPCIDDGSETGSCDAVRFGDQSLFLSFPTTPGGFIQTVLGVLLSISGMVAVTLIIRSGYQYMTSRGNPDTIQEARDRLTSAIVGLLFIIFSLVILQVIGVDILQIPGFGN